MLRDQIKKDIEKAVSSIPGLAKRSGAGKYQVSSSDIQVSRSSDLRFGDYSTNVVLKIASMGQGINGSKKTSTHRHIDTLTPSTYQSPLDFAKVLAGSLKSLPYVEKLEVAGPGFLNFFIRAEVWQKQVGDVLRQSEKYGSNDLGAGKKARIEFVSANPTGPLHFGNARGGPIGDVLANVLQFSGWQVLREYIDNDRGNQVLELGRTLAARATLIKANEETLVYKGEYTKELAQKIKKNTGDFKKLPESGILEKAGDLGVKIMFEEIIRDCEDMGIKFDYIVHESDLQKMAPEALALLEARGLLKKYEGAVWFAPNSEFLKDKDAVVVKTDGSYTYFTADVVYHKEKFESGYDLVIDVFGSNTFGHVPKLKALAQVFGFDFSRFVVILYQFVRIKRGKEVVKMSKRAGNFVTAREVMDEVGRDALRFFILLHDANTHMDFDLELAKRKSTDNPVYYVQYAHARISSILAKSKVKSQKSKVDYSVLTTNYELELVKQIARLPELVEDISKNFAVHRLTAYAIELADSFHRFYEHCKVLGGDEKLTTARLGLVGATQIALANTLKLLGISAPSKM